MPPNLSLFHAAPLHYLPHIIQDGSLFPKSILATRGIRPRATAVRRDRMLGLSDYVHLSTNAQTPLLADKIALGYPHVVIEFPREAVLNLPGVALLPYNTKAWRDKASFVPITNPDEQCAMLHDHDHGVRCPSLEVLVRYGLGLEIATGIYFINNNERKLVSSLLGALNIASLLSMSVNPVIFQSTQPYVPTTLDLIAQYFDTCRAKGMLLTPEIAFD